MTIILGEVQGSIILSERIATSAYKKPLFPAFHWKTHLPAKQSKEYLGSPVFSCLFENSSILGSDDLISYYPFHFGTKRLSRLKTCKIILSKTDINYFILWSELNIDVNRILSWKISLTRFNQAAFFIIPGGNTAGKLE